MKLLNDIIKARKDLLVYNVDLKDYVLRLSPRAYNELDKHLKFDSVDVYGKPIENALGGIDDKLFGLKVYIDSLPKKINFMINKERK
ncbi:capsid protein [PinkBerry-associated phage LS06-2018-MD08]|nr:capsid protein [PinkBerry-associated phage LS06-2018-MD08]